MIFPGIAVVQTQLHHRFIVNIQDIRPHVQQRRGDLCIPIPLQQVILAVGLHVGLELGRFLEELHEYQPPIRLLHHELPVLLMHAGWGIQVLNRARCTCMHSSVHQITMSEVFPSKHEVKTCSLITGLGS